jgi:hypothetical protein
MTHRSAATPQAQSVSRRISLFVWRTLRVSRGVPWERGGGGCRRRGTWLPRPASSEGGQWRSGLGREIRGEPPTRWEAVHDAVRCAGRRVEPDQKRCFFLQDWSGALCSPMKFLVSCSRFEDGQAILGLRVIGPLCYASYGPVDPQLSAKICSLQCSAWRLIKVTFSTL